MNGNSFFVIVIDEDANKSTSSPKCNNESNLIKSNNVPTLLPHRQIINVEDDTEPSLPKLKRIKTNNEISSHTKLPLNPLTYCHQIEIRF